MFFISTLFSNWMFPFTFLYLNYLLISWNIVIKANDSNITTIKPFLKTMPGGFFSPWQQIPPEAHMKVKVKSSAEQTQTAEKQPYVPDTLPVLNYDAQKNIILNMYCVRGNDNRLVDAGKGKLCAQILAPLYDSAFEAEIQRFLCGVFQVRRDDINVTKTGIEHERKVTVAANSITSGLALERLLDVLESPASLK